MDNNSAELARAGLGAFADVLTPQFREIRELLAAQLAGSCTLEGLRNAELSGRANFELVSRFIEQLPTADESQFLTDDIYTAKQLQANTIWLKMYDESSSPRRMRIVDPPYYVIGQRSMPPTKGVSRPTVQLLLFGATADNRGLREVTVWEDQYQIAQEEAQRLATSDTYDPAALQSMFDQDSMKLRVSRANAPLRTDLARQDYLDRGVMFARNNAKRIAYHGLDAQVRTKLETTRLDDAKLAEFDVPTRLNLLAVTFSKVDELDSLLQAYSASAPQVPASRPVIES